MKRAPSLVPLAFCVMVVSTRAVSAAPDADVRQLLEGVKSIAAPGVPGSLGVFGPDARAVVVGGREGRQTAVVACSRWKKGRVVAWAHDGYLLPDHLSVADTAALFKNAVRWAAGTHARQPHVGVLGQERLAQWLGDQGFKVTPLAGADGPAGLSRIHVLVAHAAALGGARLHAAVKRWLAGGGGLILADCGWGWAQLHPGRSLAADHPGNQIVAAAGLLWTDGTSETTTPEGHYKAVDEPSPLLNASLALDRLLERQRGTHAESKSDVVESRQAAASVLLAISVMPQGDTILMPKLLSARKARSNRSVPSPKHPIAASDGIDRVLIAVDTQKLQQAAAHDVKPHPAASIFPGDVSGSVKPVNHEVAIDTPVPDWHGTGLYAPAGKVIAVTLPRKAVKKGLSVRIGCHTDTLWNVSDAWRRMPEISRAWPLESSRNEVASGFGGPIYIVVPDRCELGKLTVRVEHAVEAPRFVLGQTSATEWATRQRALPGPWAELESAKLIITVPSSFVRGLGDPAELMRFWDRVLDADADLAAIDHKRRRPERFVVDEQISAGYMHSGYPLMTHLDVARYLVDSRALMEGKIEPMWGLYHELGHNHQSGDWTFDGSGEVTNNLFTMYVFERVVGRRDKGLGLMNRMSAADRRKRITDYRAGGARFSAWKADPFLALCMYLQLQETFGWEPFQKVFAEYRHLPAAARPRTDDEKRDQWMIRFAKQVNKNLGPFFEAWGVPTSQAARDQIAGLPRWMPEEFSF